jgi:hypothetical protein
MKEVSFAGGLLVFSQNDDCAAGAEETENGAGRFRTLHPWVTDASAPNSSDPQLFRAPGVFVDPE